MSKNKTTDNDKRFRRIVADFKAIKGAKVQVGYFLEEIATIAAHNEYGTEIDGKVHSPERSFLRSTFDNRKAHYRKLAIKYMDRIINGTLTVKGLLMLLGLRMTNDYSS